LDVSSAEAYSQLDGLLRKIRKLPETRSILLRRRFIPLRLAFYADLWQRSAAAIGATAEPASGGGYRICRAGQSFLIGAKDVRLDREQEPALADKARTHAVFRRHGLPVPGHLAFRLQDLSRAEAFFEAQTGPVVVKPADGTGAGRGVTTGIRSATELRAAARYAAKYNPHLLVEQQIAGQSHRLLFLDGEYMDAVRRDPPVLVGDGRSTIKGLVQRENRNRLSASPITALSPLVVDQDARNTLMATGLTPDSRPASGQAVTVKQASNENAAAQNHTMHDIVHPETIRQCRELVQDLGLRFCGIDVMTTDISRTLQQTGGACLEINTPPGIHHHYLVSAPERAVPVAEILFGRLFESPADA